MKRFVVASVLWFLWLTTCSVYGEKAVLFTTSPQNSPGAGGTSEGGFRNIEQWGFSTFSSHASSSEGWVFDDTNSRFHICDTQLTGVQNWLKSPFIPTKRISRIEVKIMYAQVDCRQFPLSHPDCTNELKLHYLEASGAADNRQLDSEKYVASSRVISAESYLESLGERDDNKVFAYFDMINLNSDSNGLFLLIGDHSSCSVIHSIELTYFICPTVHKELVKFPETVVGQMDKEVYGNCVPDASRSNPPRATCRFYGSWEFHKEISENCVCNPGFEPTANMSSCKPCDQSSYKSKHGNHFCNVCPMNSYAPRVGSIECQCKERFYRGKNDSADSACEQPPPAPRNLQYEMKNTVVKLSWQAPILPNLYQRRNICYQIQCRGCPPLAMEKLANQCTYSTEAVIYDLEPETTYVFTVHSANSITEDRIGLSNRSSVQLTTGKLAKVTDLTVEHIGRQGIKLSWNCDTDALMPNQHNKQSTPNSPGGNFGGAGKNGQNRTSGVYHPDNTVNAVSTGSSAGYPGSDGLNFGPSQGAMGGQNIGSAVDVRGGKSNAGVVFEVILTWKGQPRSTFTTSSTTYATSDLDPGFWGFQVCVEGVKATCSSIVNKEVSKPEIVFDLRHIIALAGIGTTIVVLVIITMILSVWCIRNNLASASRGEQLKWASQNGPFHSGGLGNQYVSNHSPDYNSSVGISEEWMHGFPGMQTELPPQILHEWGVQTIELSRIEFNKTETPSHPSGLPDLIKARLSDHTFSQQYPTLIKQAAPKSYSDLGLVAHEVATCGQFQHPNVLYLYGIALNGPEMLICLEYTGRGTLDRVIKDMAVSGVGWNQVVHLLRGVASGMQFFADLGYVHKVLNSENVYVTESDVCKIAGFDTRAVLDAEEAENTDCTVFNALMPWLAPEVSAGLQNAHCRQYSLMSDVWSFGVLVWECLSAEKPFTGWHPHEVIRATTSGYRLPMPKGCSASLSFLMMQCWNENPMQRIPFMKIHSTLEKLISNPVEMEESTLSFLSLYNNPIDASQQLKQSSTKTIFDSSKDVHACSPATTIEDWLQQINMDHCVPNLRKVEKNYMTIADVINIDSKTLKSLGISNQDRKILLKSLESLATTFKPQIQQPQASMKTFKAEQQTGLKNIAHSII